MTPSDKGGKNENVRVAYNNSFCFEPLNGIPLR